MLAFMQEGMSVVRSFRYSQQQAGCWIMWLGCLVHLLTSAVSRLCRFSPAEQEAQLCSKSHYVTALALEQGALFVCAQAVKQLLSVVAVCCCGVQKVKLVDAGFIWTEPHSKRLKVKLTIQDEVMNGTILQQGFVVEFVVENHMCLDCNRANANPNSWTACVQVGQSS